MNRNVYILAVAALLAGACTGVKTEGESTDIVNVTCTADWSQESAAPSYVFDFAAVRTLKSVHYYEDGIYTSRGDEDLVQMEPGEYEALFCCCTPMDAYQIENKSSFLSGNTESLRVLSVNLPRMKRKDFEAQFGDFAPLLVNRYDSFPRPQAAPLYMASMRANLRANGGVQNFTFQPRAIHQQVTFHLTIVAADETLSPTRVVANITGTPFRVEMLSGRVNASQLGQTFVEFRHVSGSEWECTVQLLGIIPPADPELETGPGIMHIKINFGPADEPHTTNVAINLKPYLDAQPLLRYTDEENYYQSVTTRADYVITKVVELTYRDTENNNDAPISSWEDPEDGDVHDILDGYDDDENA